MIISEQYKKNLKRLAGLVQENIEFKTTTHGRSEAGTLSWYAEEYILNFAELVVNALDTKFAEVDGKTLQISASSTKIAANTFTTKLIIVNHNTNDKPIDFLLSISVNFEQNSNTTASITIKGVTNKFAMNSKHSLTDLETLKNQIVDSVINSLTLLKKD